jgi:hypothetical protein
MMEDPEFEAEFLQPLKLQGVADILENALVMRFQFTVRPNVPTYIQREAIKRLYRLRAHRRRIQRCGGGCSGGERDADGNCGTRLDRHRACSALTTGVQITRSICGAPVASMTNRSKPRAMPDASGITAKADKKSSSIG